MSKEKSIIKKLVTKIEIGLVILFLSLLVALISTAISGDIPTRIIIGVIMILDLVAIFSLWGYEERL